MKHLTFSVLTALTRARRGVEDGMNDDVERTKVVAPPWMWRVQKMLSGRQFQGGL